MSGFYNNWLYDDFICVRKCNSFSVKVKSRFCIDIVSVFKGSGVLDGYSFYKRECNSVVCVKKIY